MLQGMDCPGSMHCSTACCGKQCISSGRPASHSLAEQVCILPMEILWHRAPAQCLAAAESVPLPGLQQLASRMAQAGATT